MIASGFIPCAQQRDRLRPVADVDDGLRRRRARAGFGPQHAVADAEHARLHRAADLAGGRVVAEDRERRHRSAASWARSPGVITKPPESPAHAHHPVAAIVHCLLITSRATPRTAPPAPRSARLGAQRARAQRQLVSTGLHHHRELLRSPAAFGSDQQIDRRPGAASLREHRGHRPPMARRSSNAWRRRPRVRASRPG